MLDTFERFELDRTGLARQLEALPGSYNGPTRVMDAPYGVIGFGEGALAAEFARAFIDAASTSGGTQFILAGGMDFGQVEASSLIAEASGATVFQLGHPTRLQSRVTDDESSIVFGEESEESVTTIASSPLGTYHYAMALAYTTDNLEVARATEDALAALRDSCRSDIPSEENPAKQLAWKLWTRTPLLLPSSGFSAQPWAWQFALSRLGKSMSIPSPGNAVEVAASGFEARHESGDALVALFLGGEDESLRLVREILETRVDEVIEVPSTVSDPFAANLAMWYLACWVGLYLSLLYGQDPQDSSALRSLREGSPGDVK
jgi:Phosphoglucose isomerase N-terminal domain/Bacterial phospho-glucose isomerase C-terminal SIS domain